MNLNKINLSFVYLLITVILERFAYFFVSFVVIISMMTEQQHGGLGFPQSFSYNVGTIYSLSLLILPLLIAAFIDKYFSKEKALLLSAGLLLTGYLVAWSAFYLTPLLILLALTFCSIGSAFAKPTLSSLVAFFANFSQKKLDIFYTIFIVLISFSSLLSAHFASVFVNRLISFSRFFLVSAGVSVFYYVSIIFLSKKIKFHEDSSTYIQKSYFKIFMSYLICFLVGVSTSLSSKFFSLPTSFVFWVICLISIIVVLFLVNFLRKKSDNLFFPVFYGLSLFSFLIINLYFKKFGEIASVVPSIFASFDLLCNFTVFPIALSVLARSASRMYFVFCQALALFFYTLGNSLTKTYFYTTQDNHEAKIIFTMALFVIVTLLSIWLNKKSLKSK